METLHLWFKWHSHCPFIFNIPLAASNEFEAFAKCTDRTAPTCGTIKYQRFHIFRLIEWPYLKSQIVSAFVLIFYAVFH